MEAKKRGRKVKFESWHGEILEGILEKDSYFWGGYKVSTHNSNYSIKTIKIIENMEAQKEFTLKKYDNLDELILAVYQDGEVVTSAEDLKECTVTGLDQNEEEITFDFESMKEGIQAQGVWGWYDGEGVIHYWIGKNLTMEELIHFFAHEIGHGTGEQDEDDFQEEMRAEEFGHVATAAYKFALEVKNGQEN